MLMYSFPRENCENWLDGLSAELGVTVKDHLLRLPSSIGEGTILAQDINDHLSWLLMDLHAESELVLRCEAEGRQGFSLSFDQAFMTEGKKAPGSELFLTDTRDSQYLKIPAGSTIQRLVINYSGELIRKYLPADLVLKLEGFARAGESPANKYFIPLFYRDMLRDLFDMEANDPLAPVKRLALIIRLTEKFLTGFLQQEQDPLPRRLKKNDLESMRHIEQILGSRLEGFPSLESLAQEVFMSTSKLKTLFKQVYGYTLYDYYNKSRLQRAKEMLVTGQFSIKQAGCEIGFSNLSHFAKAFKKEYGVLPRDIVRNR